MFIEPPPIIEDKQLQNWLRRLWDVLSYEEGEYEPTVTGSTSGSYVMSTYKTAAFTKIGRVVHVQGYLKITSESSPVGDIHISLPFEVANLTELSGYGAGSALVSGHGSTLSNGFSVLPIQGGSYLQIYRVEDDGTLDLLNKDDVDTAWDIIFSVTYLAAT